MLILTRKINESITIGDDIRITITKIARGQVGIGIDAPKDVKILRDELGDYMDENLDEIIAYQEKKPIITYR